ncbi:hypothetical protein STCU_11023 [Strigomonas culicis]|uniref:Autophagy-related protein 2 n=1 Tax=Strigomonas culicis TaxID=28005 RepID=S9UQ33_9TRYP|nr:hypothetical protein STCU_11023 [Strigomonas culicis]|eukprot:EPY16746.1 hypothetical protein STCU_11023 [Strigomonas culicis]
MLEKQISAYIVEYLGHFIEHVNEEQLQVSLWSGQLVLRDLQLRADVLEQVSLLLLQKKKSLKEMEHEASEQALLWPFTVVRGVIRELVIAIPWSSLDSQPIQIKVKGVEIVLAPLRQRDYHAEEEKVRAKALKKTLYKTFTQELADEVQSAVEGETSLNDSNPNNNSGGGSFDYTNIGSPSSPIASLNASLFGNYLEPILKNAELECEDVSVVYSFDYQTLHPTLAAAASVWIQQIKVHSDDEGRAAPSGSNNNNKSSDKVQMGSGDKEEKDKRICKNIEVKGITVAVHNARKNNVSEMGWNAFFNTATTSGSILTCSVSGGPFGKIDSSSTRPPRKCGCQRIARCWRCTLA